MRRREGLAIAVEEALGCAWREIGLNHRNTLRQRCFAWPLWARSHWKQAARTQGRGGSVSGNLVGSDVRLPQASLQQLGIVLDLREPAHGGLALMLNLV